MSISPSSPPSIRLSTPRTVITNLISSLASAPLPPSLSTTTNSAGGTQNPLKSLPQSHRPLLITLHVLFPSLALPALDLLDRNLVTRVVPESASPEGGGGRKDNDPADPAPPYRHPPDSAHDDDAAAAAEGQGYSPPLSVQNPSHNHRLHRPLPPAAFHLVRSVASTMSRRNLAVATSASASTTYLVELDAWNCTCANFAFEAFPAAATSGASGENLEDEIMNADEEHPGGEGEVGGWQFGGLSLDGLESGGVPCCKHLLACLFSEQWGNVMGKYVTEKVASREEMAGLIADI